jgi:cytochrome c-type biogenesis protein CcmE
MLTFVCSLSGNINVQQLNLFYYICTVKNRERFDVKNLQKLIIPGLVVLVIAAVYIFYLSPKKGLGNFDNFDPNAHVQKEINVLLLADQGILPTSDKARVVFFVKDKKGQRVQVSAPNELPDGFENAKVITLFGHLHQNSFEAVSVSIP